MNETTRKVHKAVDRALKYRLRGVSTTKKATQRESCCAVYEAIMDLYDSANDRPLVVEEKYRKMIKRLGLKDSMYFSAFSEFEDKKQRQLARAIWLDWVKLMMEEGVVEA